MNNSAKGFVVVELVAVLAVMFALLTIMLATVSIGKSLSRNEMRRQDLAHIAESLQRYKNVNGSYPLGGWYGICEGWGSRTRTGVAGWIPNLSPTYMEELPVDPNPAGPSQCYLYYSNGEDFKVMAYHTMEAAYGKARCPAYCGEASRAWCEDDGANTYAAYSSGGACW